MTALNSWYLAKLLSSATMSGSGYRVVCWLVQSRGGDCARAGADKSRGYCLEMICADFLAGVHLDNGDPEILLHSISRYYKFLPGEQRQAFLENLREKAS